MLLELADAELAAGVLMLSLSVGIRLSTSTFVTFTILHVVRICFPGPSTGRPDSRLQQHGIFHCQLSFGSWRTTLA